MKRFENLQRSRAFEIIPDFLMNWITVTIGYRCSGCLIFWNLKNFNDAYLFLDRRSPEQSFIVFT